MTSAPPSTSCLPNLFIIGAPKCGTTSLHDYLASQPGFSAGIHKEPHFFNHDHPEYRHAKTLEQYLGFYNDCHGSPPYVLDSSTNYIYSKTAIDAILQFNPAAKFIVLLRDPVSLVRSLHQHLVFRQIETEPVLATAWQLGPVRDRAPDFVKRHPYPGHLEYKRAGQLGHHLAAAMQRLGSDQLLTLFLEDLKASPKATIQQLAAFLGTELKREASFKHRNAAKSSRYPKLNRLTLFPGPLMKAVKSTAKRVIPQRIRQRVDWYAMISANSEPQSIPAELERAMREFFREDIGLIAELTQRDLHHWLKDHPR